MQTYKEVKSIASLLQRKCMLYTKETANVKRAKQYHIPTYRDSNSPGTAAN